MLRGGSMEWRSRLPILWCSSPNSKIETFPQHLTENEYFSCDEIIVCILNVQEKTFLLFAFMKNKFSFEWLVQATL